MFVSILEVADISMLRSPIFEDLYSPKLDFRIFVISSKYTLAVFELV